ncbi:hypothetical protein Y695_04860 [Hydrogenophaga sp. T4]|nr:hypothetical protein Y695_04860 [Hydrogenophaga sp. T4]
MRNTQPSSTGTFCCMKPQPASSMMAISRFFTKRISTSLGYLSASWPLVAEKIRYGKINSAPITSPAMAGGSQLTCSW